MDNTRKTAYLDIEADVVSGKTLGELLVVHLDGLDFGGHTSGSESDDHTRLDSAGLDTSDRHCANATNLVDILEGKTERLAGGTLGAVDGVDRLEKGLSRGLSRLLGLLLPP